MRRVVGKNKKSKSYKNYDKLIAPLREEDLLKEEDLFF
tara:strand:- start:10154 stop:10267 length:114 start_codon:yes stop_codon:yes gene_type:complete